MGGLVINLLTGKNVKCSSSQPFEKIARHEDIIKLSCSLELVIVEDFL